MSITKSQDIHRPERSLRTISYLNLGVIGGLHLAALAAIAYYLLSQRLPSVESLVLLVVLYSATCLGVTLGYHRCFTHRGLKCSPVLTAILLLFSGMALQGHVVEWVGNHKKHHQDTDIIGEDPHTPREYRGLKGILWAHIGWLFFPHERQKNLRFADYLKNKSSLFELQARWILPIMASGFILPWAIAGWDGLLVAGIVRVVLLWHVTWCINSVCHLWGKRAVVGGKIYLQDDSRNNWLLALVGWGEGYHANHHLDPKSAAHRRRWWQPDGTWLVILMLEWLGAVSEVRRPNNRITEKQLTPRYEQM